MHIAVNEFIKRTRIYWSDTVILTISIDFRSNDLTRCTCDSVTIAHTGQMIKESADALSRSLLRLHEWSFIKFRYKNKTNIKAKSIHFDQRTIVLISCFFHALPVTAISFAKIELFAISTFANSVFPKSNAECVIPHENTLYLIRQKRGTQTCMTHSA